MINAPLIEILAGPCHFGKKNLFVPMHCAGVKMYYSFRVHSDGISKRIPAGEGNAGALRSIASTVQYKVP